MSAQVFNWVWLPAAPPQPRELDVAPDTEHTVVVPRVLTAVILYPSLMTPCVYRHDPDDPWLELLIQSKEKLTPEHINRQLKLYPSLDANKHYHPNALFAGTHNKIEVEEAKADDHNIVRTHAHFWGVIHSSALERLVRAGLKNLYRVRVHRDALSNAAEAKAAFVKKTKDGTQVRQHTETYDALIQDMLKQRHKHGAYGKLPEDGLYGFKLQESRGVQLWNEGESECVDLNEPIQSYHPVYYYPASSPARPLNFGHLSDIHVNGRLDLLQCSPAQVIPGTAVGEANKLEDRAALDASALTSAHAKPNSAPIKSIIEPTNRSFQRLLDAMAADNEVDSLLIGGDLIDHQANTRVDTPPTTMTGVWDAVGLGEENLKQSYALGVDMISFYTLLIHFCRNSGKPVFGIAGNHDFYLEPFGISPRAATVRANEGIPADVNLTFYEAALAFGPTWGDFALKIPWTGGPASSFEAEWAEWFYSVFTPFSDFRLQLTKQELVCLEHIS